MACGAGLPLLAFATAVGHFVIMFIFPKLAAYIPRQRRMASKLRIAYKERQGLLQAILVACTQLRFAIDQVEVDRAGLVGQENGEEAQDRADWEGIEEIQHSDDTAVLTIVVKGKRPISQLIVCLGDIQGVVSVRSADDELEFE